jgi:sugar/nucleoside kinase (ribokinase family)
MSFSSLAAKLAGIEPNAVTFVGHALVDVTMEVADGVPEALGLERARMCMVGKDVASRIERALAGAPRSVSPGGAAANTAAGFGMLAGGASFYGTVADDELGKEFVAGMESSGVRFDGDRLPVEECGPTGRCYVLVTPDGERSMATFLGASSHIEPVRLRSGLVGSRSLFLEGYALDTPSAEGLVDLFCSFSGGRVFSLADPGVIERHRERVTRLVRCADVVFGNRLEREALFGQAHVSPKESAEVSFVLTHGGRGYELIEGDSERFFEVEALRPVDSTGAGDAFAAGTIWGLWRGLSCERALSAGHALATSVIMHHGARPTPQDVEGVLRSQAS